MVRSASGLRAEGHLTWRTIMPRIDLWWPSAAGVEADQRAREARLRLQHLERLLALRILPAQSWLRQVLGLRRSNRHIFGVGERLETRSRMPVEIPVEIRAVRLYAAGLGCVPPCLSHFSRERPSSRPTPAS